MTWKEQLDESYAAQKKEKDHSAKRNADLNTEDSSNVEPSVIFLRVKTFQSWPNWMIGRQLDNL